MPSLRACGKPAELLPSDPWRTNSWPFMPPKAIELCPSRVAGVGDELRTTTPGSLRLHFSAGAAWAGADTASRPPAATAAATPSRATLERWEWCPVTPEPPAPGDGFRSVLPRPAGPHEGAVREFPKSPHSACTS